MPRQSERSIRERAAPLTDAIEDHASNLADLYAERLKLWRTLVRVYGYKHREIAQLFRVKTVTVSAALAKDANRE